MNIDEGRTLKEMACKCVVTLSFRTAFLKLFAATTEPHPIHTNEAGWARLAVSLNSDRMTLNTRPSSPSTTGLGISSAEENTSNSFTAASARERDKEQQLSNFRRNFRRPRHLSIVRSLTHAFSHCISCMELVRSMKELRNCITRHPT